MSEANPSLLAQSFPPIEYADARILILGSMPGLESLRAGQYYAHPRNAFWPIMEALTGNPPAQPYPMRVRMLKAAGIALWDVLASCRRPGSLDADIDPSSMRPNDFRTFFLNHPGICRVYFNGILAEKCYQKHVQHTISPPLHYQRLPSTSPAHASLCYEQKLAAWRTLIGAIE